MRWVGLGTLLVCSILNIVCDLGGVNCLIGVRSALHAALSKRGYEPKQLDPWYFPSVEEYSSVST